jgi:hypothetical protein
MFPRFHECASDNPDGKDGAGQTCPGSCPVATATAAVGVTTTPAGVVNGVAAALTGPVNATMVCQPNPAVFVVRCAWPPAVSLVPGTYLLQVSAPGYETTTIQMEVTGPTRGLCGCSFDSIGPAPIRRRQLGRVMSP